MLEPSEEEEELESLIWVPKMRTERRMGSSALREREVVALKRRWWDGREEWDRAGGG